MGILMEGRSRGPVCGRIECVKVSLCLADRWGFERIEFADWSIVPRIHPKWLEDVQLGAPPSTRAGARMTVFYTNSFKDGVLRKLSHLLKLLQALPSCEGGVCPRKSTLDRRPDRCPNRIKFRSPRARKPLR